MKIELLMVVPPLVFGLIVLVPLQFQLQESEMSLDALRNYNDDEIMTVSNVHYREDARRFDRGFPDFWNIKTIYSYVTAEYPDGEMKHYMVTTDVETGEYVID